MMIELWEIRNEEVHGKNQAATKQQKRKAKVAISVPALYHMICRRNHFLVINSIYPDLENEIEYATAAKLDRFIAMKTRPIHNSISKLAIQATNKVKGIVEWIKTRRKNNRAVLEILDK